MATLRSGRVRAAAYRLEQAARERDPLELLAIVANPLRGLRECPKALGSAFKDVLRRTAGVVLGDLLERPVSFIQHTGNVGTSSADSLAHDVSGIDSDAEAAVGEFGGGACALLAGLQLGLLQYGPSKQDRRSQEEGSEDTGHGGGPHLPTAAVLPFARD